MVEREQKRTLKSAEIIKNGLTMEKKGNKERRVFFKSGERKKKEGEDWGGWWLKKKSLSLSLVFFPFLKSSAWSFVKSVSLASVASSSLLELLLFLFCFLNEKNRNCEHLSFSSPPPPAKKNENLRVSVVVVSQRAFCRAPPFLPLSTPKSLSLAHGTGKKRKKRKKKRTKALCCAHREFIWFFE